MLKYEERIKYIASEIKDTCNTLYLGQGFNFPVALEGAFKRKKISGNHAKGYPAAGMKHGPIALTDENIPVIVIATNPGDCDKILSNVQEVKVVRARVVAIMAEGDEQTRHYADDRIP